MLDYFFPGLTDQDKKALVSLQKKLDFWLKDRGPLWTAQRSKISRLAILRYLEGRPLSSPAGLSLSKDGLPNSCSALHPKIRAKDLTAIKAVLSVYQTTRLLKGGQPININTIVDEGPTALPENFSDIADDFLSVNNIKPFEFSWDSFHFSTKAGPNGPAMATCLHDWRALTPRMKNNLRVLGGPELSWYIDTYNKLDRTNPGFLDKVASMISGIPVKPESLKTAKISVKADAETKSRLFGILDYWTQTALRPLHQRLFKILKQIPSDQTFNQTEGLITFRPDEGSKYHSIDLTAATDRFPLGFQAVLLSRLVGQEKAEA